MAPKRILISINAAWNVANFRMGLIRALQAAGHQVSVLAPADGHEQSFAAAGIDFHPLTMDSKGVSPLRDLILLARYFSALNRIKPDCFLGFTAKPNIYGSVAAHLSGIPVINNISGLGTAFITRGVLTWIVSSLYRVALRQSATVFFQNEDDRDLFVSNDLVGIGRAQLLPGSGIDLAAFWPMSQPSRTEGPIFLLIARLLGDKGVREFADAARQVRKHHPNARFQLLGPVNAPNRTAIAQSEIEAWLAEGVVEYLGETGDVRPFIAAADCVVLPSYREGLPRTLLEGAAMAKPLVATDVPGCREVVIDGVTGFLCKARDSGALADAITKIIWLGDEARARMGLAGRELVETTFSETVVVAKYVTAVATALSLSRQKDAERRFLRIPFSRR